ncbi:MAG: hypothetical protein AB7F59_03470 [Bdellovibrionales bacterium]
MQQQSIHSQKTYKTTNLAAACDNCGNFYKNSFRVLMQNEEFIFDSFECAINKLAPRCEHCNSRIIGHGVETHFDGADHIFCCGHCADSMETSDVVDKSWEE